MLSLSKARRILSRGVKIALALVLVIAVIVVAVLLFQKKQQNDQTATQDQSSDTIYAPNVTSTASSNGTTSTGLSTIASVTPTTGQTTSPTISTTSQGTSKPTASKTAGTTAAAVASITPYPGSGSLDWTRNTNVDRQKLAETAVIKKISAAKLSGLSDSWSNPVEKFFYDSIDFFDRTVMEGMSSLSCLLSGTMLQTNLDSKIQVEYVDGECRVIDRS